jgi:hypothetical protein
MAQSRRKYGVDADSLLRHPSSESLRHQERTFQSATMDQAGKKIATLQTGSHHFVLICQVV